MSSIVIAGDTSGTVTLQAPAVAGSTTVNLPSTPGNNGASAVVTTNSSGNLGLGVTPGAWTTYRVMDVGGNQSITSYQDGATNTIGFAANSLWNGSWVYRQSSVGAARYALVNNTHQWFTAPSGTAGNAISFTQAMTLDASGNLGVGTTAPVAPLAVKGNSSYRNIDLIGIDAGVLSDERSSIRAYNPAYSSVTGFLQWTNSGMTLGGYPNQPMTFNPNGGSGWFEAARITSGGNLLVGTTSQLAAGLTNTITKVQAPASTSTAWADQVSPLVVYGNFGGGGGSQQQSSALTVVGWASLGAPGAIFRGWWSSNQPNLGTPVLQFQVAANGNVTNTNNSYGSLSDARLKENIVDATPKLDSLNKLRVVNFNLKQGLDKQKQIGLIAQEVEQVFPGLVETDGEGTKSVKYSVLVPMLLKAVQELNAKVEALTAELNTLKGQA